MNPDRITGSILQIREVVIGISTLHIDSELKLEIEKLISDGRGMSRYEGRVIFIPEVIPGESVLAAITRIYPGYAEARLVRVLRPSPDRVPPPCPHFGTCGGCSLQYIEPKQQFEYKIDAFVDSLKRIAKIPVQSLPEVRRFSSSSRGYRNRMRFIAGEDGVWGLRAMQSNRVVELSTCVIAHERIREAVENPSLPAGVMPGNEFTVFADNSGMWFGNEQVSTTVLGHSFSFPADKFFQSNKDVLEEGLPYIIGDAPRGTAADLYGGTGLFSVFLAEQGHSCISVDTHTPQSARSDTIRFRHMTVEKWIRTEEAKSRFSVIMLDPPRTGLSSDVRKYLSVADTREIRYLSCNPDTFARDAGDLVRKGWKLTQLAALDFYPHTSHVEVFGVFG